MGKEKCPELKLCTKIRELRKAFNEIKSSTAGDVRFCASASLFTATKVELIEALLSQLLKQTIRQNSILSRQKRKRHPTPYQLKVGRFLKEGKSIQEAHRLVKEVKDD